MRLRQRIMKVLISTRRASVGTHVSEPKISTVNTKDFLNNFILTTAFSQCKKYHGGFVDVVADIGSTRCVGRADTQKCLYLFTTTHCVLEEVPRFRVSRFRDTEPGPRQAMRVSVSPGSQLIDRLCSGKARSEAEKNRTSLAFSSSHVVSVTNKT